MLQFDEYIDLQEKIKEETANSMSMILKAKSCLVLMTQRKKP